MESIGWPLSWAACGVVRRLQTVSVIDRGGVPLFLSDSPMKGWDKAGTEKWSCPEFGGVVLAVRRRWVVGGGGNGPEVYHPWGPRPDGGRSLLSLMVFAGGEPRQLSVRGVGTDFVAGSLEAMSGEVQLPAVARFVARLVPDERAKKPVRSLDVFRFAREVPPEVMQLAQLAASWVVQ